MLLEDLTGDNLVTKPHNKRQHKQALRALDSQQVARLCGERYES